DALALAPLTARIAYLNDGDWTVVSRRGARFFGHDGAEVRREVNQRQFAVSDIGKGNFHHFMEKELHEHPAVIANTLRRIVNPETRTLFLRVLPLDPAPRPRTTVSACGGAFYAGMVGGCWLEWVAPIPTAGDGAGEFRYRPPPLPKDGLGLLVS